MQFMTTVAVLVSSLFLSTASFGAHLNLTDGESVTLSPNTYTTVTCSTDGQGFQQCQRKVELLTTRLNDCVSGASTSWCVEQIWPSFKANNPSCVDDGAAACLHICKQGASTSWCVERCK